MGSANLQDSYFILKLIFMITDSYGISIELLWNIHAALFPETTSVFVLSRLEDMGIKRI